MPGPGTSTHHPGVSALNTVYIPFPLPTGDIAGSPPTHTHKYGYFHAGYQRSQLKLSLTLHRQTGASSSVSILLRQP